MDHASPPYGYSWENATPDMLGKIDPALHGLKTATDFTTTVYRGEREPLGLKLGIQSQKSEYLVVDRCLASSTFCLLCLHPQTYTVSLWFPCVHRIVVFSVIPGSPADSAGIWADDEVLAINDENMEKRSAAAVGIRVGQGGFSFRDLY
jgi:predicted metalloprotease with PDZ domain